MRRFLIAALVSALGLPVVAQAAAQTLAKELFGAMRSASAHRPAAFGGHARGCLAGGVQLPETGPTWQAMRLSRNRNWGHPAAIAHIRRLSAFAATRPGWRGLYIGDIAQPRGGPMPSGHQSHQLGLDIDIWMLPARDLTLSRDARENLASISTRRAGGAYVNSDWTPSHHAILRHAAQDPAVARIFVFPGAKVQMCRDEGGDRRWLRKIRPWWGHHYHFHVRLACPPDTAACTDQQPPPTGDGCAEARHWVRDILNPPPPDAPPPPTPRREYVLADLPRQCAQILLQR